MQEGGGAPAMTQDQATGPAGVTGETSSPQAGEAHDRWWWVEPKVWTERMLKRLEQSEPTTVWFAGRTDGLRRMGYLVWQVAHVLMDSLAETPLTGEPDAGNPPVRFGGRGGAKAPSLPLSKNAS